MDNILTYLSVLLAVYSLSSDRILLQWKLSTRFWKLLFWLSLLLLFLYVFPSIRLLIIGLGIKNLLTDFFRYDKWWNHIAFLLVWFHVLSILNIILYGRLREWNKKYFLESIETLINKNDFGWLYNLVSQNLHQVFRLKDKKSIKQTMLNYFDSSLIVYIDDIHQFGSKENIFQKVGNKILYKILKINNTHTNKADIILSLILQERIVIDMANNNELLWLSILKKLLSSKDIPLLKKFSETFLVRTLSRPYGILSQQIHNNLEYENMPINQSYVKLLIDNREIIDFAYIIDKTINNILQNTKNIELLNQKFEPWDYSKYRENHNIVEHVYFMIKLLEKIPFDAKTSTIIHNACYYIQKDIIGVIKLANKISDTDDEYEKINTWATYLLNQLFDTQQEIINDDEYLLGRYFSNLQSLLNNEDIPRYLKAEQVKSFYYYLFIWDDKSIIEKKFEKFKEVFLWTHLYSFFRLDEREEYSFLSRPLSDIIFQYMRSNF